MESELIVNQDLCIDLKPCLLAHTQESGDNLLASFKVSMLIKGALCGQ